MLKRTCVLFGWGQPAPRLSYSSHPPGAPRPLKVRAGAGPSSQLRAPRRGGASGGPALSAPRSRLHPALLRAPAQPVAAAAGGRPEGTGGGGGGGAWEAAPCGQRQGSVWRRLRWAPRWGTGPRCSRPGAVFELRGRYCLRDGEGSGLSERKALVLRETLPAGQMSSCRCPGDRGRVGVSLPLSAPS